MYMYIVAACMHVLCRCLLQVLFFTCKLTGGLQGEHENKENLLVLNSITSHIIGLKHNLKGKTIKFRRC